MGVINSFQRMSVEELRAETISLLKQAYADGRINVETLERRLKDATEAENKESLIALVVDIPAPAGTSSDDAGGAANERTWHENERVPRDSQSFFAVMGSSEQAGRWQPARQITCFSLMGGIVLDFREADFPRKGVRINTGCIMGGLEVIIPPGINADVSGIPLMGGFDNKSGSGIPNAPTIEIRGFALMGGVEVKRKEPKTKKANRKGHK